MYLFITKHTQICITLSVTTSTEKCSFSSFTSTKNVFQNTIGQQRPKMFKKFNGLALLYIHRNITIKTEKVLNELSGSSRKISIFKCILIYYYIKLKYTKKI